MLFYCRVGGQDDDVAAAYNLALVLDDPTIQEIVGLRAEVAPHASCHWQSVMWRESQESDGGDAIEAAMYSAASGARSARWLAGELSTLSSGIVSRAHTGFSPYESKYAWSCEISSAAAGETWASVASG